jgi:hypothetical protein
MKTAHAPTIRTDAGVVLAKATIRACALMGLSGSALGKIIGLSEASVSRMTKGDRPLLPDTKEGELAVLLVRVYRSLDALVGNDEKRRLEWLNTYNHGVNGPPKELLQTAQGLVRVVTYLDGMRAVV